MSVLASPGAYGTLIEPTTLQIQRVLPGPIERVWAYLTESDLRRQWLAAGDMEMKVGAEFELVWRNNELSDPPGQKPDGFGDEHRLRSVITEADPPHTLSFTWGETGGVTFGLEAKGKDVILTVTHRRVLDRNMRLNVSAGWHMHLDVLVARMTGTETGPFWDGWVKLKEDYQGRLPA